MRKTLIGSQASVQPNRNLEGFNAKGGSPCKSRNGILCNNEDQCDFPDSRIGFGSAGSPDESKRTETLLSETKIMEIRKLKPWDMSWFSDVHNNEI